ncbi:MAG: hypothetical protein LQ350_004505 [Teloschistes chrysophthalmus]|nr:MAG: hypothetical protein LQ350_004505 [Niorma chrysophthalma]
MRGGVHDTFDPITIHTAKCDLCNKHNTSTMFRCTKCGRQCCTPCWDRKGGDGRHSLHNNKQLEYKGPKAEPLPPPEAPKPAAAQPKRRSTRATLERKRGRDKTATDAAEGASNESPAASAAGSVSTGEAEVPAPKRRRRRQSVDSLATELDDDNVAGKSTNIVQNPWYLPTLTKSKEPSGEEVAKDQNAEVGESHFLSRDHATPSRVLTEVSQSATTTSEVTTTTAAAGHDEQHTAASSHDLSRDHNGLNVIVEAADLLERQSSASGSVAAVTPPPSVPSTLVTTPSATMGPPPSTHKNLVIAHSPEGVTKKNMLTPVPYEHGRSSNDTQPSAIAHSPEGVKKKQTLTPLAYNHTKDSKETHNTPLDTTKKTPTTAALHSPQKKSNNEHLWNPTSFSTNTTSTPTTPRTPMVPRPPHRPSIHPRQRSTGSYDPRNDPMNPYAPSPSTTTTSAQPKKNPAAPENIRTAAHGTIPPRLNLNLNEAGYAQNQNQSGPWTPINTAATAAAGGGSRYQQIAAGMQRLPLSPHPRPPHNGYASGQGEYGPVAPTTPLNTTTWPRRSLSHSQRLSLPGAGAPRATFSSRAALPNLPRPSLPNPNNLNNPYANLPVLRANPPLRPTPTTNPHPHTSNSRRAFDEREIGRDERAAVALPRYVQHHRARGLWADRPVETGGYEDEDEEMELFDQEDGEGGEEEGEEGGDIYHPGPRR